MTQRFTMDGSDALEQKLEAICDRARDGVLRITGPRMLRALVLGGGYGRGEGGVLATDEGDQPYNDLEFYVLLKGNDLLNQKRFGTPLHHLGEVLSRDAGIEIEFKPLALDKLRRSGVTMFYYDLVSRHRLVQGHADWLSGCDHHRAAQHIPMHEATRLLMNRCSGLLFAEEHLSREKFNHDHADFVGRNFAKAKLAFGDVLLATRGQYHWSCQERHKRLKKLEPVSSLSNFTSLLPLHEQGLEFKLHPFRCGRSRTDLVHELSFLKEIALELFLWLESRRLTANFPNVLEYCRHPGALCPETLPLKNRLINARRFGLSAIVDSRYPRERILRSLPHLLWETGHALSDGVSELQKRLRTDSSDFSSLVRAYESIWKVYN